MKTFIEQLDKIANEQHKAYILLDHEKVLLGTIMQVETDYLLMRTDNGQNPYVYVPIDKIISLRLVK